MKYCEDFAALLDLYVDGELSPGEMVRVQAHLDECPACRAYVDDALAIRAAFPSVEDTQVPDGFAEGVMAAIRAQAAPRKKSRPWLKAALPLAACLALVVLVRSGPLRQQKFEAAADAASVTAETATEVPEAAAEEEAPAELESQVRASAEDSAAPQIEAYMAPTETQIASKNAAPVLTLTEDQAGSLLAEFTPVEETETVLRYELTASEYEALLDQLASAGIASEENGNVIGDTVLVEVIKE